MACCLKESEAKRLCDAKADEKDGEVGKMGLNPKLQKLLKGKIRINHCFDILSDNMKLKLMSTSHLTAEPEETFYKYKCCCCCCVADTP